MTQGHYRPGGVPGPRWASVLAVLGGLATGAPAVAQIQFDDVTIQAQTVYDGESYGASWGDQNGDGLPDLFVNHHRATPSLYINLGDGRFEDRWYEVDRWRAFPLADQHGGAWGDFDADGDQDLFVSLGRWDVQQFLVNNGQVLTDMTQAYSLDLVRWEGRQPIWVDIDHDGLLDTGVANRGGLAQFYAQVPGQPPATALVRRNSATGHQCNNDQYLQLADLNLDGALDLVCPGQQAFPRKLYDMETMPFTDITALMPTVDIATDSAVADFDGNLQSDILVLRGFQRPSGAEIAPPENTRVEANLITNTNREKGIGFVSTGDLNLTISWNQRNPFDVHIGASGYTLGAQPGGGPLVAQLSASDPNNVGLMPHDPGTQKGIYIGYEPETATWTILLAPGGVWNYAYLFVDSTAPISNLSLSGLQSGDKALAPMLFVNQGGAFVDGTKAAGLKTPILCVSAVPGDFDNDMDTDLFLVCRGPVNNLVDLLYENQGNGTFALASGFGAEGPTGLGVGLGENAVTADYDVDGFLDLFVTNGLAMFPEVDWTNGGPDQLFRNRGNANHWIELDLTGVTANRDGVGAIVYAHAGGKTQLREHNGGYHRWAQSHQRLHFGLGTNQTVDLEVHWPLPSTQVDTYTGLAADKLYRLTEGGGIVEVTPPASVPPSPCHEPVYDKATERGLFLWKDCNTGTWSMRVSPGGQSFAAQGNAIANQPFDSVLGVSVEANDLFDFTSDPARISYGLAVEGTGTDGFDFVPHADGDVCFTLDSPADLPLYLGHLRTLVEPPFSLTTLGPCTGVRPGISVSDIATAEDDPIGAATFTLTLSASSDLPVTVDVATADGLATAPGDYTALPATTVEFAPGQTARTVSVPIVDDPLAEGSEDFMLLLSNAVDGVVVNAAAKATILDDEPSPCGAPVYDKATEQGLFLWRDCPSGLWHIRVTAGGASLTYQGGMVAGAAFPSVAGFSIEASDLLDYTTDPLRIDYRLIVSGAAQDGIDFAAPEGADVCLTPTGPAGMPIYVGAARSQASGPLLLRTMGACSPP